VTWDRNTELRKLAERGLSGSNLTIAKMWVYQWDLELQGRIYADAKTEYGRRKARIMIEKRLAGEKSGELCAVFAEDDPTVAEAHLAYRLAEQMVGADKEALKVLHAELDDYRTKAADARAADSFIARTQT
jgi:hypothetical protein